MLAFKKFNSYILAVSRVIVQSKKMNFWFENYFFLVYFIINQSNGLATDQASDSHPLNLMGFLPMTGTGWAGGGACLPASLMAVRHVNERPGLLDGYNLTYTWVDTQVSSSFN